LHSYNFQRLMSRLEQRWRAQRTVISIVNCRIPWINRNLNVDCAFGISLKACLLQCPIHFMPATRSALAVLLPVCVCVLRSFLPLTHEGHGNFFRAYNNLFTSGVFVCVARWNPASLSVHSYPRHEVRSANPLNLSI